MRCCVLIFHIALLKYTSLLRTDLICGNLYLGFDIGSHFSSSALFAETDILLLDDVLDDGIGQFMQFGLQILSVWVKF